MALRCFNGLGECWCQAWFVVLRQENVMQFFVWPSVNLIRKLCNILQYFFFNRPSAVPGRPDPARAGAIDPGHRQQLGGGAGLGVAPGLRPFGHRRGRAGWAAGRTDRDGARIGQRRGRKKKEKREKKMKKKKNKK
eukprot:TRINITY_DN50106_c0_g1_i2.p2 TRINITY_DN50106_c0_g1~~TRINITY_DN50106_c0_g1_i2.p2  ORF type:complete len:136 (+),score=14.92 TRINITY_DN50106_c0_g1_i2:60-467(+)